MEYTVVIERAPNNFAAYVPDLPGCIATGSTREELLDEIREAIAFHIESLREHGEPVPEPQTTAVRRGRRRPGDGVARGGRRSVSSGTARSVVNVGGMRFVCKLPVA